MSKYKLPSYEELFGSLDYSSADEYRSALSPAAYLTDIMDLKNWNYDPDKNDDPIDDRRPDISEILLNAENTITEIPYLDVVNEIMENRVSTIDNVDDAYTTLKDAKFPFNLPFNRYKTEINILLDYFKTKPLQFYNLYTSKPKKNIEARESLGFSEEQYQEFTTPVTDIALKEYYGLIGIETLDDLVVVTRFRKATELSALQVTELLFQNLSYEEQDSHAALRFFINKSSSTTGYLKIKKVTLKGENGEQIEEDQLYVREIENSTKNEDDILPPDYFERINRFLRVSHNTGLSFADLDLILITACGGELNKDALEIIAVVILLQQNYEIPVEQICTFFSAIKDYGKGENTIPEDMFNRLFNNGFDKNVDDVSLSKKELKSRLQSGLECTETEYDLIESYLQTAGKGIEPTPERLALPYRIKKLADIFGIPVESLFILFNLIDKNRLMIDRYKFQLPIGFEQTIDNVRDIITIEKIEDPEEIQNILWLVQLLSVLMLWLNDNEMSVEQLEFICTENSSGEVDEVPGRRETEELFRELDGVFRPVLFNSRFLETGITDTLSADMLYQKLSNLETGVFTPNGIIRSTTTAGELIPVYLDVIKEKLFIEAEDLTATGLEQVELDELFRVMQNKDYIDLDSYISSDSDSISYFINPQNATSFLLETDRNSAAIIFSIMSERAKSYSRASDASEPECAGFSEKITVQSERQQSILFGTLEDTLNLGIDSIKILCLTIFRTADETEQMATVRFMAPVLDAFDRELITGILEFHASLVTSYRRLLQFTLLALKTDLQAEELDVLFYIEEIQKNLPEKLKLPAPFNKKIDAMYHDAQNNITIFTGGEYIRFSGKDYAYETRGTISELSDIPTEFKGGINAAFRDWAPVETDRQTYFFTGEQFSNAKSPDIVTDTAKYWGKVHNHIAELSRVDAAYRTADGYLYLFSGDQYVRYSDNRRDYIDESYPKNTLRYWNDENQIQLPIGIREKVDAIFLDNNDTTYFFSDVYFVDSVDSNNVQKTRERWAQVINNIVDNNHVDAAFVKDGVSYLFSGNQFTRYSTNKYGYTDEGYPLNISSNWNSEGIIELNGNYLTQIDAAFNGNNNQVYMFNGNTFVTTENSSGATPINEKWGKVRNTIIENNTVDAAIVRAGKTYLFSGDQYVRYSGQDDSTVDEGYPKRIARWNAVENFGLLPDTFNAGITAALTGEDDSGQNIGYFFSGNVYISALSGTMSIPVKDHWALVRNNIQANNVIDAGFIAADGMTYLFSGDQFYRYSTVDYALVDEAYPLKTRNYWGDLPESFRTRIDAAFTFTVDGSDRTYLFSGNEYVRYSSTDYSSIDSGYPRELGSGSNREGEWFEPIFNASPKFDDEDGSTRDDDKYRRITTIFTEMFNNQPRINFFYYDDRDRQYLITYVSTSHNNDDDSNNWSKKIRVSDLNLAPFTAVDVGFYGANSEIYIVSEGNITTVIGDYTGVTAATPINDNWGLILNKFQDLNRVDAAYLSVNGSYYLFCDSQYIKYSGSITPEQPDFYCDEAYPKTIGQNWSNENSGIALPALFAPSGYAIFTSTDAISYAFSGNTFVSSTSNQPTPINQVWGTVLNNFVDLNRIDAAYVHSGISYLFSGNQYIRYSTDYSGYVDEEYPRQIQYMAVEEGIDIVKMFPDGIDAIMSGTDGSSYAFAQGNYVSSEDPTDKTAINSNFGLVRNNIIDTGIIEAADAMANGVMVLFSGDQYVRYSTGNRDFVDEGYPKSLINWKDYEPGEIPIVASKGITAQFTDFDDTTYCFTETEFFTLDQPDIIKKTNTSWGIVKNNIQQRISVDAAFITANGTRYLFSKDQYVKYSANETNYVPDGFPNAEEKVIYVDEGFPKTIADNWGALPDTYRAGLDAASVFDGRTYFFKDETYIRYSDPAHQIIDSGVSKLIEDEMGELPEFKLNQVKTFQQFKLLSKIFNNPDNSILTYLSNSKDGLEDEEQLLQLSTVTGWNSEEIDFLKQDSIVSATDLGDIQVLTEMNEIFQLADLMELIPSTIKKEIWDKVYGAVTDLQYASLMIAGQLKIITGISAWGDLASEFNNKMNLVKRDALLTYLIYKMEQDQQEWGTEWIENPRDLYEYLLIDVQMGEQAITSRIQEAIMCMQLFYHRTLINLEEVDHETMVNIKYKLKSWWGWMQNYRVWEANRKVFIYPENYLRPELRVDKSPEFKELEEALLQGDINDDTVDNAFKTYLDKYNEVSRLNVAGGYVYQRPIPNLLENIPDLKPASKFINEKKIIMFGHSNTEPKTYYYMTGEIIEVQGTDTANVNQVISWSPWKSIGISINSNKVYPVFSFNKIFVFWVEIRERDQSVYNDKTGVGPDKKTTQYDVVIFYSFFNSKGEWTAPQQMFDIGNYIDKLTPKDKNDPTHNMEWKQRALFIDEREKVGEKGYIPVLDVLNGARLYVTNPITSSDYSAEEYIFISYDVRYEIVGVDNKPEAYEFTFEGKLKSNLELEQGQVKANERDKLEKNVQPPLEKFGMTPVDFNHWKGFYNDSFSAPWFSFNAGGGSFLLKPNYVVDAPDITKDKCLFGITWKNLPDSGFTDQSYNKHLFYRDQLSSNDQSYVIIDKPSIGNKESDDKKCDEKPVNSKSVKQIWGIRSIFDRHTDDIDSATVNGDTTFIVTKKDPETEIIRYISYTGPGYRYIDQTTVDETKHKFCLEDILTPQTEVKLWQRVKGNLSDFISTLENAFVYNGNKRLYLVAKPNNPSLENQGSGPVRAYTVPDFNEFFAELAELVPEKTIANTIRNWTSVQSANLFSEQGIRRLYITFNESVFVKDYITNTNSIHTISELTHPDFNTTHYDSIPTAALQKPWATAKPDLKGFINRLTGVAIHNTSIRFIAKIPNNRFEYTAPEEQEFFETLSIIIDDTELSPVVAALTELSAAELYSNGNIKRLYIRSVTTIVVFSYSTGTWSVFNINELTHPDVIATKSSLTELIPAGPALPWIDVANDFDEYMKTVQRSLVWEGVFYLITPKVGGGIDYTTPTAKEFWAAVAEKLPEVASYTAIDSSCVFTENDNRLNMSVSYNDNVVLYEFQSEDWVPSTISEQWPGVDFGKLDSVIQASDEKVYLFSANQYAEQQDAKFITAPVKTKWGEMTNVITGIVDSAFMDESGQVYLFSGESFVRYANVDTKIIDEGYPKNIQQDLGINMEEVKNVFSADKENVSIDIKRIVTNTAFTQTLRFRNYIDGCIVTKHNDCIEETKKEKMYLFLDIDAEITTYTWRSRWRWWGRWKSDDDITRSSYIHRAWWGWWWQEFYLETSNINERKSVYMRFDHGGPEYRMDEDYPKLITGNWSNLPGDFNNMITGTFSDFDSSSDKQILYVVRTLIEKENGEDTDINHYVEYIGKENFPKEITEEQYEIVRLTSNTAEILSQKLFIDGIDGLLSLNTQQQAERPVFEMRKDNDDDIIIDKNNQTLTLEDRRKNDTVLYKTNYIKSVPSSDKSLDFDSVNAQYYWEIFFHAPFLIAQTFNNAQKFDEGTIWYERIFDPTEKYDCDDKLFWKFLPFYNATDCGCDDDCDQSDDLNNLRQYKKYLNDPFDPHAIAGLRQVAYRKTILMNYIDNLIDQGDMLFRQYTRETINEARMFYVLAYELLGTKPELIGTRRLSDTQTYKQLRQKTQTLNMALVEMENLPVNATIPLPGASDLSPNGSLLDPYDYFYIPENSEFIQYWDRIDDRLQKIRYSLNIDGIKQNLPLFEPPLDVMSLVRAVGSGMGLAQTLSDYRVTVPHYRFNFILAKSRELTSRVIQFGQSLLSALEKKDAEELALLRNNNEKVLLKLTLQIKNAQLDDTNETLDSLRLNLKSAQIREQYYNSLLSNGLSSYEQSQLGLLLASQVFNNLSSVYSISASIGGTLPEVGAFAFHWGGHNLEAMGKGIATANNMLASNFNMAGTMASILGGHHRREQDWDLQHKLASTDIESIQHQVTGAEIKVKIAVLDIKSTTQSIKNLESVDTFMKSKFTNQQLYRWMSSKLSGLYFQTYQMALDMAKAAEKSFQFELGYQQSEVDYISAHYWDSLKKGLLAGETLQVDLDRMETAYIEKNARRFEISKTVSLLQHAPLALLNLKNKRVCEFALGEELFDYDFPGHYRRQIKTISISFPAVAGPYENINATLTQLSHRTLIEPDKAGVEYLLRFDKDAQQPDSIRADWRTNQQIALSRGVNDAGLFQLNFQDERYLPYEGTGAVSSWRLELNGQQTAFDVNTLTDVVIKIEYSALQGGDVFASTVKKLLGPSSETKMFNLAQDFSAQWNHFMENPSNGLKMKVTRDMFRNMSDANKVTGLYMLYSLSNDGVNAIGNTQMYLNSKHINHINNSNKIKLTPANLLKLTAVQELKIAASGSNWQLKPISNIDEFTPENISDIALICVYEKKPEF